MHVPTMVIASSSLFGTFGSSILPSAMACFRSASRALTSCETESDVPLHLSTLVGTTHLLVVSLSIVSSLQLRLFDLRSVLLALHVLVL